MLAPSIHIFPMVNCYWCWPLLSVLVVVMLLYWLYVQDGNILISGFIVISVIVYILTSNLGNLNNTFNYKSLTFKDRFRQTL